MHSSNCVGVKGFASMAVGEATRPENRIASAEMKFSVVVA